jgi:hypothetical protein
MGTKGSSTKCERPVPPLNRLEDRIRTLSERLLQADGEEFQRLAVELRAAITEHVERIRSRLAQYPLADDRRSPKREP